MTDPAAEAAQALVPLLAAGADAALGEIARQAGAGIASKVRRVLETVRRALGDEEVDEEKVASVLRAEIEARTLTEAEVQEVARFIRTGRDNYGVQIVAGKNVFFGGKIKTKYFQG